MTHEGQGKTLVITDKAEMMKGDPTSLDKLPFRVSKRRVRL
jgi:hypothetical protein